MLDLSNLLPGLGDARLRGMACAAGLVVITSAGYCVYRSLRRRRAPPAHLPAQEPVVVLEGSPDQLGVLQVIEPNWQLLPAELDPEQSVINLLSSARGLTSVQRVGQFCSGESYSSQFESAEVGRYFRSMMRGPDIQLWWFQSTRTHRWNPQCVSGRVTEFVSSHRLDTFDHVPLEDCVQTFYEVAPAYLHMGVDGQVNTSHWVEVDTFYPSLGHSEAQSESEESEERLSPKDVELPFISYHLADSGVTHVGLKLHALREAFSIMFASIHNQNFLYVTGKKLVMRLAAANKQDVVGVQLAYDSLIRFLRGPSNQESIRTELFEAQLHHLNFMDVFYELILFGCFVNDSAPEALDGGFLERLFILINLWDVEIWEPAAELYFTVLVDQLTVLLEVLFSQPLELYSDPAGLATVVLRLLKQHVQQMMKAMESI